MSKFTVINILDLLETMGEENLKELLAGFSCPLNEEIEYFIRHNAIDFAKKKISITYLIMDKADDILAIFTLAQKAIEIKNEGISMSLRKKIERYSKLDLDANSYTAAAFLVAQLGKNFQFTDRTAIDGNTLMEAVFEALSKVQRDIGGGIIFLECEDKTKLLEFYQNERNHFRILSERHSDIDNKRYIQLYRIL